MRLPRFSEVFLIPLAVSVASAAAFADSGQVAAAASASGGGGAITVELVKILASSLISILCTGIWLQRWQYREHFIEERIDDLIAEVDSTADLAALYWERSPPTCDADRLKDRILEANIFSRQMRIARMRVSVCDFLDKASVMGLFSQEGNLFSAFTGGGFKTSDRVCEKDRFDRIRNEAGIYVSLVRDARRKRVVQGVWRNLWN